MKTTVFYSWQSDLPNPTNRTFILSALEKAKKELKADPEITLELSLDKDTQGKTGSPDISQTIFDKIDKCQVFVCDVSIVNGRTRGRHTPNPNVLIELGYAVKVLGWDRVVMVANTAFGKVESLPFDIRGRRIIFYHLPDAEADRNDAKRAVQIGITSALRSITERGTAGGNLQILFDNNRREIAVSRRYVAATEEEPQLELSNRVFVIYLQLIGKGSNPITEVDILLKFPPGVFPRSEPVLRADLRNYPEFDEDRKVVPALPKPRGTFGYVDVIRARQFSDIFDGVIRERNVPEFAYAEPLPLDWQSLPKIRYAVEKMKANKPLLCEQFYVLFPDWQSVRSFDIMYTLNADGVHEEGVLKYQIEKEGALT